MASIYEAVQEFRDAGAKVLSPSDPRVVDQCGDFLFVASDRLRSIRLVEDRHLHSIKTSSLLWLVAPDGYVGQSAAMEIGLATASGTPVFSDTLPSDGTLREYVTKVASIKSLLSGPAITATTKSRPHVLVDPTASIESMHRLLDSLAEVLQGCPSRYLHRAERDFHVARTEIADTFGF